MASPRPMIAECACLAGLVAALCGCGRDESPSYRVHGAISYQGRPITNGTVMLQPHAGKAVIGSIRPDGSFELRTAAGSYRVGVTSLAAIPDDVDVWEPGAVLPAAPLPAKYQRAEESGITLEVAANDDNVAIISLPLRQP